MKKIICFFAITAFIVSNIGNAFCQNTAKNQKSAQPANIKMPAVPTSAPAAAARPMITTLFGTVSKIDASDPSNVKIEMMNDSDKKVHNVSVPPSATVVQVTDASNLKQGDVVRVMAQSTGDKETALNVAFGKVKAPQPFVARTAQASALPAIKGSTLPASGSKKSESAKNADIQKLLEAKKAK